MDSITSKSIKFDKIVMALTNKRQYIFDIQYNTIEFVALAIIRAQRISYCTRLQSIYVLF